MAEAWFEALELAQVGDAQFQPAVTHAEPPGSAFNVRLAARTREAFADVAQRVEEALAGEPVLALVDALVRNSARRNPFAAITARREVELSGGG